MINIFGLMLPISDGTYIKPMVLPHGGWPMATSSPGMKQGRGSHHTLHLAQLHISAAREGGGELNARSNWVGPVRKTARDQTTTI